MSMIHWKLADEKLRALMGGRSKLDVYMAMNILVPLRNRLHNGKRSLRLYNEIMRLRVGELMEESRTPQGTPATKPTH
ncbi:MAG: hypothetical protein HY033_03960 [Ignavibacteriae bacterium]|nr:hypothetical protein [Ignavibacteria bacterium]MBI3364042.1 hypothetical protein [Ignavibacteriota bacterium]